MPNSKTLFITLLIAASLFSCTKEEVNIAQPVSFTVDKITITETDFSDRPPADYEHYEFSTYLLEFNDANLITGSPKESLETIDCKDGMIYSATTGFLENLTFTFNEADRTFEQGFVLHTLQAYSSPANNQGGSFHVGVQTYGLSELYNDDEATTFEAPINEDGFQGMVYGTFNY